MLVINDRQSLMSLRKVLHGEDKVLTVVPEDPSCTDDIEIGNMFLNQFFSHTFGTTVLSLRIWLIVYFPFLSNWFFTVKNVVG